MTQLLKYFILLILIFICTSANANDERNQDTKLYKLIELANYEMNGDFNNKQEDGTFRKTNKFHLEIFKESVAYVAVVIESYIDILTDEFKTKELDFYRYVKLNPEFKNLLDYLIEHNLPLYQFCITKDCKYKSQVIIFRTDDLKQFGILAE